MSFRKIGVVAWWTAATLAGILVGVVTHTAGDGSHMAAWESVTAGLVTFLTLGLAASQVWEQASKLRAEIASRSPGAYEAHRSLWYPAVSLGWLAVSLSRPSQKWAYIVTSGALLACNLRVLLITISWVKVRRSVMGFGLPPQLLSGALVFYILLIPLLGLTFWLFPAWLGSVRWTVLGVGTAISLLYVVVALGGQFRRIWQSWSANGVEQGPLKWSILRSLVIASNFGLMFPSDGVFAVVGFATVGLQLVVETATLLLIRRVRRG